MAEHRAVMLAQPQSHRFLILELHACDQPFAQRVALRDGDTEVLSEYRNRTSLDLSWCNSLQNVDGLADCTKLTSLGLSGCTALSVLPVEESLTTRKQVAAYQERIKKAMK